MSDLQEQVARMLHASGASFSWEALDQRDRDRWMLAADKAIRFAAWNAPPVVLSLPPTDWKPPDA